MILDAGEDGLELLAVIFEIGEDRRT